MIELLALIYHCCSRQHYSKTIFEAGCYAEFTGRQLLIYLPTARYCPPAPLWGAAAVFGSMLMVTWCHGYCTKGGATHELTLHFSTEGHDQPLYHAGPRQCIYTTRQEHSSRGCSDHCTVAEAIIIRLSWETSSDLSSSKINTVDTGGHDITHHEGVIRKIRSR